MATELQFDERKDIRIDDMSETNPTHSAFYAMWTFRMARQVLGSPLGRGATKDEAIRDLIGRTETESEVKLQRVRLIEI